MSEENGKAKKPFTVKGFFKSTSFKCIAVLLAIVLISGILLTICNSLFYVSDAERLQRVLSDIYGKEVTAREVSLNERNISSFEIAEDGSTAGYGDSMADEIKDGSMFLRKTESDILSVLNPDGEFTTGNLDGTLATGATYSNFLCTYAALFATVNYSRAAAGEDISSFERTKYIDTEKTSYTSEEGAVKFTVVTTDYSRAGAFTVEITVGADGKISEYAITVNGSSPASFADNMAENVKDGSLYVGKDSSGVLALFPESGLSAGDADNVIATGATYSNFLCTYAALFALANYDAVYGDTQIAEGAELEYTQYIDLANSSAQVGDDEIDYTIVTTDYGRAGAFTLNITVRGSRNTQYTGGSVNSAYYIEDDGNYLVNATGTGGFSGGTVTCWVVVAMNDGSVEGVDRVVIESNVGQSYISKVNRDDVLQQFEGTFSNGEEVSAWSGTGATMSLTAIAGAVNTALSFAREELAENTVTDPLAGYGYTNYINSYLTTVSKNGSDVYYSITTTAFAPAQAFTINVTVGENGVIAAYEIATNGSTSDRFAGLMPENVKDGSLYVGKGADEILSLLSLNEDGTFGSVDGSLTTGATYSNFLCTYAALFAAANYEYALENAEQGEAPEQPDEPEQTDYIYTNYIDMENTSVTTDGTNVNYSIVTTGYAPAQAFTINVTVGENGVITAYEIATNGSTSDRFTGLMPENVKDGSLYVGKGADEVLSLLSLNEDGTFGSIDGNLATGATRSNFLCTYAALFAAANYEYALEHAGQGYVYTKYIDLENTAVVNDGEDVTYSIASNANGLIWGQFKISVTVGKGGIIKAYRIVTNGSSVMPDQNYGDLMADNVLDGSLFVGKSAEEILSLLSLNEDGSFGSIDGSLSTGATYSNFLCTYAALFAAANYDYALENSVKYEYMQYIDFGSTTFEADGSAVKYSIVTTGYAPAQAFTINVTVGENGVITAYEIATNGSTSDRFTGLMPENVKDGSLFVGKGADEILSLLSLNDDGTFGSVDGSLTTGATRSNFLCTYAALFAAANYDIALGQAGGAQ